MTLERIARENYRRLTWKNGVGFTDEIAIHPPGSELKRGNFLWRISSARIERSSPFSVFPDHDRILLVLDGEGLRLTHTFVEGEPEEVVELPPLEPYEFPGDVPSRCDLVGSGITDFSVFFKKGEVEASVEVIAFGDEVQEWQPSGRTDFLFVVDGTLRIHSPEGETLLRKGDSFSLQETGISLQIHAEKGRDTSVIHTSFIY